MIDYKLIVNICLLLVNLLINYTLGSSLEPCLSAQSVDLSHMNSSSVILPIDCQCNNNDIICIDLNLYNENYKYDIKLPTLSLLFQPNELGYLLPKQRFSFFGYKSLVSNAFDQVKFVNDYNATNFTDQSLFIDFIESNYFPTRTFSSFGNLADFALDSWPRVYISIVVNENNSLILEENSISNMSISILSFEFQKADSKFNTSSLRDSRIQNLIIKNSNGFIGFDQDTKPSVEVKNLAIDKCYNFNLDNDSLANFINLESLTLTSSDIIEIANGSLIQFDCLKYLSLKRNYINDINENTFNGVDKNLISLDLSYNPLNNFDWNAMNNLTSLVFLDLSYTNITSMEYIAKKWPPSPSLESISLNGYAFLNDSMCTFDPLNSLNLSSVLIELDPFHECNCFVFYVYKSYRSNENNNISDWLLANRTPVCYRDLFDAHYNFSEIEQFEQECNFDSICSYLTSSTVSPTTRSTRSTKKSTTTNANNDNTSTQVQLNQASVIVIACLAALSFILIICIICLITYFLRKPPPAPLKPEEEYYRV